MFQCLIGCCEIVDVEACLALAVDEVREAILKVGDCSIYLPASRIHVPYLVSDLQGLFKGMNACDAVGTSCWSEWV